jgi:hypothetical protein
VLFSEDIRGSGRNVAQSIANPQEKGRKCTKPCAQHCCRAMHSLGRGLHEPRPLPSSLRLGQTVHASPAQVALGGVRYLVRKKSQANSGTLAGKEHMYQHVSGGLRTKFSRWQVTSKTQTHIIESSSSCSSFYTLQRFEAMPSICLNEFAKTPWAIILGAELITGRSR